MPSLARRAAILLALAILAIVAITSVESPPDLAGRVVSVHDGDTLTIIAPDKQQVRMRLHGIDAPEFRQPFGNRAKEELNALVYGKVVTIRQMGQDQYNRMLGRVFVADLDVNLAMVERGYAWRYVAYSSDPALIAAEERARAGKRGLWADKNPVPPWEWRRRS